MKLSLSMFDDITGAVLENVSLYLPISGQNIHVSSPIIVNIPISNRSLVESPGITITAYSSRIIEGLFNISRSKLVNETRDGHVDNSGRLLSDMVHIDISENIDSIGYCSNQVDYPSNNMLVGFSLINCLE